MISNYRFSAPRSRKYLSTIELMAVSVVQNENLPFSRVFYDIFKTLFKVCVFLRAAKITRGGELNFVAVLKFGLGSIYQG